MLVTTQVFCYNLHMENNNYKLKKENGINEKNGIF